MAGVETERPVRVRVRLFAAYREAAGNRYVELSLQPGAHVADVIAALYARVPALDTRSGLIAVNQEYVGPEFPLRDGDEVALIPPVSGGA